MVVSFSMVLRDDYGPGRATERSASCTRSRPLKRLPALSRVGAAPVTDQTGPVDMEAARSRRSEEAKLREHRWGHAACAITASTNTNASRERARRDVSPEGRDLRGRDLLLGMNCANLAIYLLHRAQEELEARGGRPVAGRAAGEGGTAGRGRTSAGRCR